MGRMGEGRLGIEAIVDPVKPDGACTSDDCRTGFRSSGVIEGELPWSLCLAPKLTGMRENDDLTGLPS